MHNITKSYATEDSFINECKIINLEIEYRGATSFVGTEHYAIVTNLSEEALISKYDKELASYKPFVIIGIDEYLYVQLFTQFLAGHNENPFHYDHVGRFYPCGFRP